MFKIHFARSLSPFKIINCIKSLLVGHGGGKKWVPAELRDQLVRWPGSTSSWWCIHLRDQGRPWCSRVHSPLHTQTASSDEAAAMHTVSNDTYCTVQWASAQILIALSQNARRFCRRRCCIWYNFTRAAAASERCNKCTAPRRFHLRVQ